MPLQDWERTPAPWAVDPWHGIARNGATVSDEDLEDLNKLAAEVIAQCSAWLPHLLRVQYPPSLSGLGVIDEIEKWFAGYTFGELVAGRRQAIHTYFERYCDAAEKPEWKEKWQIPDPKVVKRGLWMQGQGYQEYYGLSGDAPDPRASVYGWQWQDYSHRKIEAERGRHALRRVTTPLQPDPKRWVQPTEGANVRSDPSLHAPIVDALPKGATVCVSGAVQQADGLDWAQLAEDAGWIAQHLLATSFVQAAPADAHAPIEVPQRLLDVCPPELDACVLTAIASIESGLRTRDLNGNELQERFEGTDSNVYLNMGRRWAHDKAQRRAFATSWGVGQIMGFHHEKFGKSTPLAFVKWLEKSPRNEWLSLVKFIQSNPELVRSVQKCDWDGIARIYNGAGYLAWAKKHGSVPYNDKLALAYQRVREPHRAAPAAQALTRVLDGVQAVRTLGQPQAADGAGRKVARYAVRESAQLARPTLSFGALVLIAGQLIPAICQGERSCEQVLRPIVAIAQALNPDNPEGIADMPTNTDVPPNLEFTPTKISFTPTPEPTSTPTPLLRLAPEATSEAKPVNIKLDFHVRAGPREDSEVVAKPGEHQGKAFEFERDGGWVHVRYHDWKDGDMITGWVREDGVTPQ